MKVSWGPLAALCLLASLQAQASDGQRIYTQGAANPAAMACSSCHGSNGLGMAAAGFPRLASLPAGYLVKQLKDFRTGARINPLMQPIAKALSDDELEAVAKSISAMPAPRYPRIDRAQPARRAGEVLALRGAWARNVPECVTCHGPGGVGVGETFPPLAGQPAQYLGAQLKAWRQGTRKNDPNDLMGSIARALSDVEVEAVAEYFAGLPPEDAR